MKIASPSFPHDGNIPVEFTGAGGDLSPPLVWRDVPKGARSLALTVDDPDAPAGVWVHWLAYNIPPERTGFGAGVPAQQVLDDGTRQGQNSFGSTGYGGPYPPAGHGPHRYFFRLFALDTILGVKPGAQRAELEKAMAGHVLARAEFMGRFERTSTGKSATAGELERERKR